MRKQRCVACDPDREADPHEAHVEVWQIGDRWVPSCSDRVLDWWHHDGERVLAGAPDQWIRPLGVDAETVRAEFRKKDRT